MGTADSITSCKTWNINGDSARVVLEVVHTGSTALVPTISENMRSTLEAVLPWSCVTDQGQLQQRNYEPL